MRECACGCLWTLFQDLWFCIVVVYCQALKLAKECGLGPSVLKEMVAWDMLGHSSTQLWQALGALLGGRRHAESRCHGLNLDPLVVCGWNKRGSTGWNSLCGRLWKVSWCRYVAMLLAQGPEETTKDGPCRCAFMATSLHYGNCKILIRPKDWAKHVGPYWFQSYWHFLSVFSWGSDPQALVLEIFELWNVLI